MLVHAISKYNDRCYSVTIKFNLHNCFCFLLIRRVIGKIGHNAFQPFDISPFRKETKYVWQFNDNWNQWTKLEDQTVMIVYAVGKYLNVILLKLEQFWVENLDTMK